MHETLPRTYHEAFREHRGDHYVGLAAFWTPAGKGNWGWWALVVFWRDRCPHERQDWRQPDVDWWRPITEAGYAARGAVGNRWCQVNYVWSVDDEQMRELAAGADLVLLHGGTR